MHHIVLRLPEQIITRSGRWFEDDLRTACTYASIQRTAAAVGTRSKIVADRETIANTPVQKGSFVRKQASGWSKERKRGLLDYIDGFGGVVDADTFGDHGCVSVGRRVTGKLLALALKILGVRVDGGPYQL